MGNTGEVKYPPYVEQTHLGLLQGLTGSLNTSTLTALSGSDLRNWSGMDLYAVMSPAMYVATTPYAANTHVDPTMMISSVAGQVNAINTNLIAQNTFGEDYWKSWFATAKDKADSVYGTALVNVSSAVAAFDVARRGALAKATNRVTAGFFDINAVVSTAFPTALALLEAEHMADTAQYQAQLQLENLKNEQVKFQFIANAIEVMYRSTVTQMQMRGELYKINDTFAKTYLSAYWDYTNFTTEQMKQDYMWDMNVLSQGSAVLGATAGIPGMATGMSKEMQSLMVAGTIAQIGIGAMSAFIPLIGLLLSDERVKQGLMRVRVPVESIEPLQLYSFHYKWEDEASPAHTGFLAQELRTYFPTAVSERPDGLLSVTMAELVPVAVGAIQDLARKVRKLELKVARLEGESPYQNDDLKEN